MHDWFVKCFALCSRCKLTPIVEKKKRFFIIICCKAYSLTWPASMQTYGTKEFSYIRKESNSHRICLEHQYGCHNIM